MEQLNQELKGKEIMTKEVSILSTSGKQVGQIALDEKVFGVEPNLHVMHMALRRQLNNARGGNACAKTRAEVSGGGRKPWKQKGTGRARAGSIRSPLFAGGGVIFGPKPRDYAFSMPQKARKLALKSALSARIENTVLVKDFSEIKEAKTKILAESLKALKVEGKILMLIFSVFEALKMHNLSVLVRIQHHRLQTTDF